MHFTHQGRQLTASAARFNEVYPCLPRQLVEPPRSSRVQRQDNITFDLFFTRLPCARSGTRPRRRDPCPSTRVCSASNVVGHTRAECATIPSCFGRGSSRLEIAFILRDITPNHMPTKHKTRGKESTLGCQRDLLRAFLISWNNLVISPMLSKHLLDQAVVVAQISPLSGTQQLISCSVVANNSHENGPGNLVHERPAFANSPAIVD
jgi:hypothetical protein